MMIQIDPKNPNTDHTHIGKSEKGKKTILTTTHSRSSIGPPTVVDEDPFLDITFHSF